MMNDLMKDVNASCINTGNSDKHNYILLSEDEEKKIHWCTQCGCMKTVRMKEKETRVRFPKLLYQVKKEADLYKDEDSKNE